jgi:hypothetical protein
MTDLLRNRIHHFRIFVFLLLIIILATAFHYPIQIIDAITSETVEDFSIHISITKVVLEPFVGPLLFYLRANQPLNELLVLMIWFIAGLLIFSIFKGFSKSRKKKLLTTRRQLFLWLAKFPIIIIIWMAILLIIIFAPLPSNTIINRTTNKILVNIHSHSHFSHDGIISPEGQIKWHDYNGFDAFFMSEHNNHDKTLETVAAQNSGGLPAKPVVICGEEFSGSNHILLLGLTRNFKTRGLSDSAAVDFAQTNGGVTIVAHWFEDENKTLQYYIDSGVDGFEIVNQGQGLSYDRQIFNNIVDICKKNKLIMLGSCDYHGYGKACFTWNALEIPGWHNMRNEQQQQSIINLLRQKDQEKITVLTYQDREIFDRSLLWFSPALEFIRYFRSLNYYQVLSWIIWVLLFLFVKNYFIREQAKLWLHKRPLFIWAILGFISGLFVLVLGIDFLFKAKYLVGYNEIYLEHSTPFIWMGIGLVLYSAILLIPQFLPQKHGNT